MKTIYQSAIAALMALLIVGCASAPSLSEQIVGQWEGEVMGNYLTFEYSESDVTVVGMGISFKYKLEGDQITLLDVPMIGTRTATIRIEGDKMFQVDNESQQESIFSRKI